MNIICPINPLGYGVTGLNIVKELSKKVEVSLWTIGQPQVTEEEDALVVKRCISNAKFFNYEDPSIRIWHQHDMAQFVGRGEHVGFPIFELDTFSPLERHQLNSVDRLLVCSKWAKDVCLNNGIKPRGATFDNPKIDIIPLGVDLNTFKPCEINPGPTIFFNCGKWEVRKGHKILPEIFNKAFTDDDDVELWIMCSNPFLDEQEDLQWKRLYSDSELGHKIRFINRVSNHREVYNIMSRVDCGVFPSKAEGWNLEPLELMACGKHVIITNYSAHTEFCNSNNSKLINIDNLEPAYDGKWFNGKVGQWAEFGKSQIDQTVEYMRDIHNLKQSGNLNQNLDGVKTANRFTWENTAEEILKNVQYL
jgi:glycosyltransferase involved in cell wall biosynthesis